MILLIDWPFSSRPKIFTIFTWILLFLEQMFMLYSVKRIKLRIDFNFRSLRNTLLNEHTYTLSSEVYWVAIQPANIEWPIPDEYQLATEETKKSMRCPLILVVFENLVIRSNRYVIKCRRKFILRFRLYSLQNLLYFSIKARGAHGCTHFILLHYQIKF